MNGEFLKCCDIVKHNYKAMNVTMKSQTRNAYKETILVKLTFIHYGLTSSGPFTIVKNKDKIKSTILMDMIQCNKEAMLSEWFFSETHICFWIRISVLNLPATHYTICTRESVVSNL
jgi:hypothetical protein